MALARHEIPTHLNVEDRAFYGLSVRQFTDCIAGLAGSYSLWNQTTSLPSQLRLLLVGLSLLLTAAMVLLKPGGRRLDQWLFAAVLYLLSPKATTWRRPNPTRDEWRTASGSWAELSPRLAWPGAAA